MVYKYTHFFSYMLTFFVYIDFFHNFYPCLRAVFSWSSGWIYVFLPLFDCPGLCTCRRKKFVSIGSLDGEILCFKVLVRNFSILFFTFLGIMCYFSMVL